MGLAFVFHEDIPHRFIYRQVRVYQYIPAVGFLKEIANLGQHPVNQRIVCLPGNIGACHVFQTFPCAVLRRANQVLVQYHVHHVHRSDMSALQQRVLVRHPRPNFLAINFAAIKIDNHLLQLGQGELPNHIRTFAACLRVLVTAHRIAIDRDLVLLVNLYVIAVLFWTGLWFVIASP